MGVPQKWGWQSTPVTLNHVPTSQTEGMFQIKETLVAAGWTIESSSDGTTYNASGDEITVAADLANTNAWFRISNPDGHELTAQHVGSSAFRIKYAPNPFTGGSPSATQTPTATGEQVLMGGGSDASPTGGSATFLYSASTPRIVGAADTSSPYGFNFAFFEGTYADGAFMMDPVIIPSAVDIPGFVDDQPYVFLVGDNTSVSIYDYTLLNAPNRTNQERPQGYNVAGAAWDSWGLLEPFFRASSQTFVGNSAAADNAGGIPILARADWCRTAAGTDPDGWKGGSSLLMYSGANLTGLDYYTLPSGEVLVVTDANTVFPYGPGGDFTGMTDQGDAFSAGMIGTSGDAVAPVITNFVPTTGSAVAPSQSITFDVTDVGGFAGIIIMASFADGTTEVVHDGFNFRGNYAGSPNLRTVIANGYQYRVRRSGGWPSAPTFEFAAFDSAGNLGAVS